MQNADKYQEVKLQGKNSLLFLLFWARTGKGVLLYNHYCYFFTMWSSSDSQTCAVSQVSS
jgi:hypothetical protein